MKFSKTGQALLAAAVSLGVGLGLTSCGQSNTIDYLYVTANKNNPGQIAIFRVDQQSGALTEIKDSPQPSGGRNPVAEVTSPNGANLYVVNHDDNTIVEFAIGTDAKIYSQHTYQTPGTEPNAIAINSDGTLLFVVDTYQATYSDTNPGPGALVVYPINKDGSLGANLTNGNLPYWPLEFAPATVNVTVNGKFVYVANANTNNPIGANQHGTISGFAVGSDGALTSVYAPGAQLPYAGVTPSASASEPTSRFLYVTDSAANQLYTYTIGTDGTLTSLATGPVTTGTFPDAITIDPSGKYLYIANYTSASISSFAITQSTGQPSALAAGSSVGTKTGPTCIMIEPAFGRFLYTTNFLDSSLTGYKLNPNDGSLVGTENSPYPTSPAGQPTCAAAVTHGNHPGEHVQATSGNSQ